jgi:hypothetical protein
MYALIGLENRNRLKNLKHFATYALTWPIQRYHIQSIQSGLIAPLNKVFIFEIFAWRNSSIYKNLRDYSYPPK